jgi:predicted DNA-binding protein
MATLEKQVMVRFSFEMSARLHSMASQQNRTVGGLVRHLCIEALEREARESAVSAPENPGPASQTYLD